MGLISEIFGVIKNAKKSKKYFNMSVDELRSLSDDKLYEGIYSTLYFTADNEEIKDYNSVQLIILTVMNFDAEVNNGGLCQFFVNSSRIYAPYVTDSLNAIGATEISNAFSKFVNDNKIKLNDLSSFIVDSIDEYKSQTKRYPFDDFDDFYYENSDITNLLVDYARNNIELVFGLN